MPKTFKWTVEFEVPEEWVADGFDLDGDRALDMLNWALPSAGSDGLAVDVLKCPDPAAIRKAQGYDA